jgi:hypothetical protein
VRESSSHSHERISAAQATGATWGKCEHHAHVRQLFKASVVGISKHTEARGRKARLASKLHRENWRNRLSFSAEAVARPSLSTKRCWDANAVCPAAGRTLYNSAGSLEASRRKNRGPPKPNLPRPAPWLIRHVNSVGWPPMGYGDKSGERSCRGAFVSTVPQQAARRCSTLRGIVT